MSATVYAALAVTLAFMLPPTADYQSDFPVCIRPVGHLTAESTRPSRAQRILGLHQSKDDVLAVIAEAAAEDVDAAGMARFVLDADPYPDRTVPLQFQVSQRTFGNLGAVAI